MRAFAWARHLALLPLLAIAPAWASGDQTQDSSSPPETLVDRVRQANDRFKDVSIAVAEGYKPIACASGTDGGAMGIHYVSPTLLGSGTVDIAHPQAVMYEPMPDGRMTLIAVEYIAPKGPASLEGQLFNFIGAPNRYGLDPFYELHVWAWKSNPRGVFADMNPSVTCENAPGTSMDRD
jgi:hypothetical protein